MMVDNSVLVNFGSKVIHQLTTWS